MPTYSRKTPKRYLDDRFSRVNLVLLSVGRDIVAVDNISYWRPTHTRYMQSHQRWDTRNTFGIITIVSLHQQ
jgi:hypothetical protein